MQSLTAWAGPLSFGLLVYLAIDNHGPSELGYNRQVAGYVVVVAAALLFAALLAGRRFERARPVLPWALAFALSVTVSTWGAPVPYWSINRLHLYYAVILLGVGFYLLHRDGNGVPVDRYFVAIPAVHVVFLVYVIYWLVSTQSNPGVPPSRFPHFTNIRHFAYHGFIAAACASSLFLMSRKLELSAFVLAAAALFGILLMGARGALLAWLGYAAAVALFHPRRGRFLLFCVAALLLAAAVVFGLTETGVLRVTTLFHRFEGDAQSGFHVSDRISIWKDSLSAIAAQPWFGFGPEGYIRSRCCNPILAQPHNFVLQFLLELGLVGSCLLGALVWAMLRVAGGITLVRENLGRDAGLLSVCAVLAGFLAYAMIDGLLYHAIPLIHFALFAALLFAAMARAAAADPPSEVAASR